MKIEIWDKKPYHFDAKMVVEVEKEGPYQGEAFVKLADHEGNLVDSVLSITLDGEIRLIRDRDLLDYGFQLDDNDKIMEKLL